MDVDKLLLVLTMNGIFPVYIHKIKLFFNFQTKNGVSTSVFIFSVISQILKTKVYEVCRQKCRNLKSIKYSKYHMPLIYI